MNVFWYMCAPDGAYPWQPEGSRKVDLGYYKQLALAYDQLGYTGALFATGAHDVWVLAGALLSYFPDHSAIWRRVAQYADRLLKGTQVSDLPFERPTKFELAINLRTARVLGIAIPPGLLLRADRVIE